MSNMDATADLGNTSSVFAQGRDERHDKLSEATSQIKGRTSLSVDRWFQLVGGALLTLGLFAIIVGWYGTSHTTRIWRQTPYVVSGGFLGLGLVFVGGFSYFAFWLTRIADETRRQTSYLQSIESLLRQQVQGDTGAATIVATDAGVAHRSDCPVIAGRTDVHPITAGNSNLRACPMCEPDLPKVPADA